MSVSELLPSARLWLRIVGNDFNDELSQCIKACLVDLSNAGVKDCDLQLGDSLVQQAVKLYLRANFGENDKAEIYATRYEAVKNALAIRSEACHA